MNQNQKDMINALTLIQDCIYTPSFTADKQSLKNLQLAFDILLNEVRTAIGQKAIKDYLYE